MSTPILRVTGMGTGITVQDAGRFGYRHRGLPRSGPMDPHAARVANQLAGNPPGTAVLELALGGAALEVLSDTWVALAGAVGLAGDSRRETVPTLSPWTARWCTAGSQWEAGYPRDAAWSYIAIPGGIEAPVRFGSRCSLLRAGVGLRLTPGELIFGSPNPVSVPSPQGLARRLALPEDRRSYVARRAVRVWRGPEARYFGAEGWDALLSGEWVVRSDSDRVGYRLEGSRPLKPAQHLELTSEPLLPGTIQVPPSGAPIVMMPDGPTMGGYPRLALVDPDDLEVVAQCPAGSSLRFEAAQT